MTELVPLKWLASTAAGGTPDSNNDRYWSGPGDGMPWVAIGDMSRRALVTRTSKALTGTGFASKPLPVGSPGTVLFAMYASVGEVATLGIEATWNQAILGLSPRSGRCDSRFLAYALRHLRPSLVVLYRSNTQDNLNAEQVGNLLVPAPALAVQVAIADYLDRETAKIDALIAKQEQLVCTLLEYIRALAVEMIENLHGPVGPLKRHWSVTDCKHITADFLEEGFALASIGEVRGPVVDLSRAKRTTSTFFTQMIEGDRAPVADDLVFSRNATVGAVARVPAETEPFAMGQDVCLLRRLDPSYSARFLWHVLVSKLGQEEIEQAMIGSTFRRINVESIRDLRLPWPSAEKQRQGTEQLDVATEKVDALVAKARRLIEVMAERRTALISAAVTGQLDTADSYAG